MLRKSRCFVRFTTVSQDLPTHHAAISERLISRDSYGATDGLQRVGFRSGNLADLRVIQPDSLSVRDRIGDGFDEVV